jgi:peptidoglycan/xylan/chitin deacetylase (PgdA/CDA1 family)
MIARRLTAFALLSTAGCFAVAGCTKTVEEDAIDEAAPADGDGSNEDALVGEHQLSGSELPEKTIALTFDDGPGARTQELAEYLGSQSIPATFFINGKNAPGRQRALQAVIDQGHIIGNHTQNHLQLTSLSAAKVIDEVTRTDDVIRQFQPEGPWLLRAPFGAWNGSTARAVNSTAMTKYVGSIFWNMGGQLTASAAADWDCWGKHVSIQRCGELYLNEIRNRGKGISLMHDIHSNTVDMVKTIIVPTLIAEGWHFAKLTDVPAIQRALGTAGAGPAESPTQCQSASLGHPVDENVCVQSHSDSKWYRCVAGDWRLSTESDPSCTQKFAQ